MSGFFGSGKSHLLKMLAHLWANRAFGDGATARSLVPGGLPPEIRAALTELDTRARRIGKPPLAAAGTLLGGNERVRSAVLSILLRARGLPSGIPQARFTFWLRDEGILDQVRDAVEHGEDPRDWRKGAEQLPGQPPHLRGATRREPHLRRRTQGRPEAARRPVPAAHRRPHHRGVRGPRQEGPRRGRGPAPHRTRARRGAAVHRRLRGTLGGVLRGRRSDPDGVRHPGGARGVGPVGALADASAPEAPRPLPYQDRTDRRRRGGRHPQGSAREEAHRRDRDSGGLRRPRGRGLAPPAGRPRSAPAPATAKTG